MKYLILMAARQDDKWVRGKDVIGDYRLGIADCGCELWDVGCGKWDGGLGEPDNGSLNPPNFLIPQLLNCLIALALHLIFAEVLR